MLIATIIALFSGSKMAKAQCLTVTNLPPCSAGTNFICPLLCSGCFFGGPYPYSPTCSQTAGPAVLGTVGTTNGASISTPGIIKNGCVSTRIGWTCSYWTCDLVMVTRYMTNDLPTVTLSGTCPSGG